MKKKKYIQPLTETFRITPPQLLAISEGWSQNEGNVINVGQEGDYWGTVYTDTIGGWGGFIDID